jgi:hypothetical protein
MTQNAHLTGFSVPRLAVNLGSDCTCSGAFKTSIPGSHHYPPGPTELDAIRVLHGVDIQIVISPLNGLVPGCPGLKEVFFVQRSEFCPVQGGCVDASIGFRPAVGVGLTAEEAGFKIEVQASQLSIKLGYPLRLVGTGLDDPWNGTKMPALHIVSLALKTFCFDKRVYDTITFYPGRSHHSLADIRKVYLLVAEGRKHNVHVTVCNVHRINGIGREQEFGLFGLREDVEKTKGFLKRQISEFESLMSLSC